MNATVDDEKVPGYPHAPPPSEGEPETSSSFAPSLEAKKQEQPQLGESSTLTQLRAVVRDGVAWTVPIERLWAILSQWEADRARLAEGEREIELLRAAHPSRIDDARRLQDERDAALARAEELETGLRTMVEAYNAAGESEGFPTGYGMDGRDGEERICRAAGLLEKEGG